MLLPYNVDSIVHFVSLSLLSCCLIPGTYQRLNDFLVHAGRLLKERFGQTCNRKQQTKPTRQRLSAGVCVCVRQPLPTPLPLNTASHGLFVLALFPAAWCFRLPRVLRAWVATTRGGTFVVVARQSKRPKPRKIPRDECRILWLCAVIAGTVTAILYSSWPANNGPIQHLTPLYILDLDSGADLGRHTCRVSETKSTLPSRPTSWETQCGMVLPHDPLGIRRSPKQRIGPLDPVMEIPMAHRMCHLCGRT